MAPPTGAARKVKLLILDEMHSPIIAEALAQDSWEVVAVSAEVALRGLADEDVLAHAADNGQVLVTENLADFSVLSDRWAADGKTHPGLVFTNPRRFDRATIAYPGNLIAALKVFLADPPINGESWVWWL